jgi:hypothetical protein
MGKVKLIKLPNYINSNIKNKIKAKNPINREGATPYTYKEVQKYTRMYVSGYTPEVIGEYYDVPRHRVYNGIREGSISWTRGFAKLRALNAKKRKMGHKLVGVEEFFDNNMHL